MSEAGPSLGGNVPRPTVAAELEATRELFENLNLPDGYTRRRLGPEDAELYVTFDDWASFDGNTDTPEDHRPAHFMVKEISEAIAEGSVFEGIFDDQDRVIATMWLSPDYPDEGTLEVSNLVVDPGHRDQGVGSSYFLEAAKTIAEMRGQTSINLHVDPLNRRGMHIYTDEGFQATGYEYDNKVGGLRHWLIMTKQLRPEPVTYDFFSEVKAGDGLDLDTAIKSGAVSVAYHTMGDGSDPKNNTVIFATTKPQSHEGH